MSRRRLALAGILVALASAAAMPAPALAGTDCSSAGCRFAGKRDGHYRLIFTSFGYHGRYQLCVTDPGGDRICQNFQLRSAGSGRYNSDVSFTVQFAFPTRRAGLFRASWRTRKGTQIGRSIAFRYG
jgi:hypothetical protein